MDKNYKEQYRSLGLNIAYYRKKKGFTQMKFAEALNIDRSHISAIELANVGTSLDVIFRMCEILEISPKELFDFR
ncbi:MAG: helix-turn-helix transcriptional regulator [Clostridia bacterium]|nr:helix-turn-helix transcriptional regulator [Clostridia bacterium]